MFRWTTIAIAAAISLTVPGVARANEVVPIAEMEMGITAKPPAAFYSLAKALMRAGRKDEAVFWFYAGQLRYRAHLDCLDEVKRQEAMPLFGTLSESIGRPINEYAFGDLPLLAETMQKALDWDAANENGFMSKTDCAAQLDKARQGLAALRQSVIDDAEMIRAERTKNGLPNR